MFGLGNLFSGLGNLFTVPNMLSAMDLLTKGVGVYGQIDSYLNPPEMPDFPRLDMQGNRGQAAPDPMSAGAAQPSGADPAAGAQQQAMRFASARSNMAERGVYDGGAFSNLQESYPGLGGPQALYAGQGQAMGFANEEEDGPYGGYF